MRTGAAMIQLCPCQPLTRQQRTSTIWRCTQISAAPHYSTDEIANCEPGKLGADSKCDFDGYSVAINLAGLDDSALVLNPDRFDVFNRFCCFPDGDIRRQESSGKPAERQAKDEDRRCYDTTLSVPAIDAATAHLNDLALHSNQCSAALFD